jgi:hypothetical protein
MAPIRPRPAVIYPLLFGFLAVFYALWVWGPALGGFGGDNAIYLLSAQSISAGGADTIARHYANTSPYPPLYPLLLSVVAGGHRVLAAHLVTVAALIGACAIFLLWLRAAGLGPGAASLYTLVLALAPGIEQQALQILSEPLYLLASLAALWTATRAEQDNDARWTAWAGLAIAAAIMTRSAGIALWIAFVAWILLRRTRRELWVAAAAMVPFALWTFLQRHHAGYLHDLLAVYHTHPLRTLRHQLGTEARRLVRGWAQDISGPLMQPPFPFVAGVLALLGLIGGLRRPMALESLYLLVYLTIILVWPFPSEAARFLVVIAPVVIRLAASALQGPKRLGQTGSIVLACALLVMVVPQWVFNVRRLAAPVPAGMGAFKHVSGWYHPDIHHAELSLYSAAALTRSLQSLPRLVPAGQCILNIKPSITAFYSHRLSYAPPPGSARQTAFWTILAGEHCRYALLVADESPSFPKPMYPLGRFRRVFGDRLTILQQTPLFSGPGAPLVSMLVKLPRWRLSASDARPRPGSP